MLWTVANSLPPCVCMRSPQLLYIITIRRRKRRDYLATTLAIYVVRTMIRPFISELVVAIRRWRWRCDDDVRGRARRPHDFEIIRRCWHRGVFPSTAPDAPPPRRRYAAAWAPASLWALDLAPSLSLLCCMQSISPCPTLRSWTLCPPSSDPHQRLLVRLRRGIQRQLAIMVKASPPLPHRQHETISPLMPQSLSSARIDRGSSSSSSVR